MKLALVVFDHGGVVGTMSTMKFSSCFAFVFIRRRRQCVWEHLALVHSGLAASL